MIVAYATHAAVQVLIKLDRPELKVNRNYEPLSLAEAVAEMINETANAKEQDRSSDIKHKKAREQIHEQIKSAMVHHMHTNAKALHAAAKTLHGGLFQGVSKEA